MKTQILIAAIALLTTTMGFATKTNESAKFNLKENIGRELKKEMNETDNYLNGHSVKRMNENVEVIVRVNENNQLELVSANGETEDAENFVSYVLKNRAISVDEELKGRTFRTNVYIYYKTRN